MGERKKEPEVLGSRALREALVRLLEENVDNNSADFLPDEPLITSGRINSLILVQLTLWIEEQVGAPLDFTRVELPKAWDTIDRIVAFVEKIRNSGSSI